MENYLMPDEVREYVDAQGADASAVTLAIGSVIGRSPTSVLLVIPTLKNFDGVVESVFGRDFCRTIRKSKVASFRGIKFDLATLKTLPHDYGGSVLALYPDMRILNKIDEMCSVKSITVVPWMRDQAQQWVTSWSPTELRTGTAQSGPQLSKVVEAALQTLTDRVNLNTGITHPSDHDAAVGLFKILRTHRVSMNVPAVRAWLVQHHWDASDADKVCHVAERIWQGRRVRGGEGAWGTGVFEDWAGESS